ITKVAFYNGNTKLGEKTSSPFTYSWNNVAAGSYTITAEATDNRGNTARSEAVTVRVFAPQTPYGGTAHAIPGKIEFEHFDEGGNGNAYYDTSPGSEVSPRPNFRTNEDVDIENCTDTGNGYNIGYAVAGEWLEYTVNVAETGTYNITFRVAADGAGRTISLATNGTTIANNVAIPNTGGWQVWQDVTVQNVQLTKGEQVLRLTIGNTDYVNLNYMTFTSTSVNAPTVTSPITYCQNATATPLTATGTALKWYTAATGGTGSTTAPTPSTQTVGNRSYFVSQTVSGQESPRAEIVVTTKARPAAPTVVSPVTYSQGETASQLTATGTALKWYTAATGGNGSTTAPTPLTTNVGSTNYYVSQTTNACESTRAIIEVQILPIVVTKLQLQAGWNLIGYPFAGEKTVEEALNSIWQYVTQVKDMDGFYSKGNDAAFQSLTVLKWGKGYLVYVSQACELIFN
ncbi:MAG: carbohydrate-binding protein, partial [Bacteroidales bacterium]|nr:carbohydrate-binding protein [Bacteroidales bacterium]